MREVFIVLLDILSAGLIPGEMLLVFLVYILTSFFFFSFNFFFGDEIKQEACIWGSLPKKFQFRLFWFSFFFGIPNQVWTKTEHGFYKNCAVILFFTFLGVKLWGGFLFVLLLDWSMRMLTGCFAVTYQAWPWFAAFVQKCLFDENEQIASSYFAFFWGNMTSRFKQWAGAASTVICYSAPFFGLAYKHTEEQEVLFRQRVDQRFELLCKNEQLKTKEPLSEMQVLACQKTAKTEILAESLTPWFIRKMGYDSPPQPSKANLKMAADIVEAEKKRPLDEERLLEEED